MVFKNNQSVFIELRKQYPIFVFEDYSYSFIGNELLAEFHFHFDGKINFHPRITFPVPETNPEFKQESNELDLLIFSIGMTELISYWKTCCSPGVIIKPAALSLEQTEWWKKLYYLGLGEFFYTNGIHTTESEFMEISCLKNKSFKPFDINTKPDIIVPVGGGKDSVVSLELLKKSSGKIFPFVINPNKSQKLSIQQSKVPGDNSIFIQRKFDPKIIELNKKGFLNGHTPFSAIVAFTTLVVAYLNKIKYIALSNESSANEATIPGTNINHQYSKSIEFEDDFRYYVKRFITPDIEYFSFLRPLNELQIAEIFSKLTKYHSVFRSCNAGSKTGVWCGKCPKCLFTYIILSPFLSKTRLKGIFQHDLYNDIELSDSFKELTGISDNKPFECVGTIDEINAAVQQYIAINPDDDTALIRFYKSQNISLVKDVFSEIINKTNNNHNLNKEFIRIIQNRKDESSFK